MTGSHPARGSAPWRVGARRLAELAAFAGLLFLTRFLLRGHLAPQIDQECHIGGIAIDVLAHGVRFPMLVYAPNEYDNGSLLSGVLAAGAFSVLGRNVLALKVVTHLIVAAGAVATLALLRACLDELGLLGWRRRWAAVTTLVLAIALAPRIVTLTAMYAVGNHAEGAAIDVILLALFVWRAGGRRSLIGTAAFWALAGLALYANKGTVLVLPVLIAAELALGWPARARLAAALAGGAVGLLPELLVIVQRHARGWATVAAKAGRYGEGFSRSFVASVVSLADDRIGLLAMWGAALIASVGLLVGWWRRGGVAGVAPRTVPVALACVLGVIGLHGIALLFMAQGSFDAYAVYGYAPIVIVVAVQVAVLGAAVAVRWGEPAATWTGVAAVALTLLLYRPDAARIDGQRVAGWWRNRDGAACSWRFAEGFEREAEYGLAAAGQSREQHAIARCRTLSEPDQVLDCIGGISRRLHWRDNGRVSGAPPSELTPAEARAYAYYYGTHRWGDEAACGDFTDPALAGACASAARLECLIFADMMTRVATGRSLGRPACEVPEPPMRGYWSAIRADLWARGPGPGPDPAAVIGETNLAACRPVFDACFPGDGAYARPN